MEKFIMSLIDITKLSEIHEDMNAEILNHVEKKCIGKIHKIKSNSDDPNGIVVLLKTGDEGHLISIKNSSEHIRERILSESHISDNKEGFLEQIMHDVEIPQTVQSFLNADGGYVYLGIRDDAKTETEKYVGLETEKKILEENLVKSKKLEEGQELSQGKFEDKYQSAIEDALQQFLDFELGKYVFYTYYSFFDKRILEIFIKSAPSPVFYKMGGVKNKQRKYDIFLGGKRLTSRKLDIFYVRNGSSKKQIETLEDFYQFVKNKY
jgi:hypothetical protein